MDDALPPPGGSGVVSCGEDFDGFGGDAETTGPRPAHGNAGDGIHGYDGFVDTASSPGSGSFGQHDAPPLPAKNVRHTGEHDAAGDAPPLPAKHVGNADVRVTGDVPSLSAPPNGRVEHVAPPLPPKTDSHGVSSDVHVAAAEGYDDGVDDVFAGFVQPAAVADTVVAQGVSWSSPATNTTGFGRELTSDLTDASPLGFGDAHGVPSADFGAFGFDEPQTPAPVAADLEHSPHRYVARNPSMDFGGFDAAEPDEAALSPPGEVPTPAFAPTGPCVLSRTASQKLLSQCQQRMECRTRRVEAEGGGAYVAESFLFQKHIMEGMQQRYSMRSVRSVFKRSPEKVPRTPLSCTHLRTFALALTHPPTHPHLHPHIHPHAYHRLTHNNTHTYSYIYAHTNSLTRTPTRTHTYITYTNQLTHNYTRTYSRIYCTHVHTHTRTRTHIYTRIHTCMTRIHIQSDITHTHTHDTCKKRAQYARSTDTCTLCGTPHGTCRGGGDTAAQAVGLCRRW